MARDVTESDWRLLRELKPLALDRFCARVLAEVARLASDEARTSHERYLDLFKLIELRDRELATAFDDLRRSTALPKLAIMRSRGLLSDEEFNRFSPEAREAVQRFLDVSQA